jgi:aryl-alcohol dehydrogenase-like predicted oxidoreductase
MAMAATHAYVDPATQHRLRPARLALAFAAPRPFVAATSIGSRTAAQRDDRLAPFPRSLAAKGEAAIGAIDDGNPHRAR